MILARFSSALVVGLALACCAPVPAPLGSESNTPTVAQDSFLTRDGLRLPLRHWDAPNPHVIIVALHGMSDYSNAFDMPGTFWATQGITTLAYDQRGFGASANPGLWPGADSLRSDLDDFVDAVRVKYPGKPVLVLGESMGGAVVLTTLASAHPPATDGAILVAPAVWSRSDMPVSYRAALWFAAHVLPGLTVSGRGLKIWPSDNIEMLRKLARDPLFQHTTRSDAVYGLVNLMDEGRHAPEHLANPPPVLLLYGKHDQIIPKEPTEAVAKELGSHAEVHVYDKGYHMLLRDLDRQLVWDDVVTWTKQFERRRTASR
jgi:alpha-beta hydrolase superfamily lysophospholipase